MAGLATRGDPQGPGDHLRVTAIERQVARWNISSSAQDYERC